MTLLASRRGLCTPLLPQLCTSAIQCACRCCKAQPSCTGVCGHADLWQPRATFKRLRELRSNSRDICCHARNTILILSCARGALPKQTTPGLEPPSHGKCRVQIEELAKDDLNSTIMCIGHNRGWEEAASAFAHSPVQLQTANAALLQSRAGSWHDALESDEAWELVGLVTPEAGLTAPVQEVHQSSQHAQGQYPPPAAA